MQQDSATPVAASGFVRVPAALTPTMHAWVQREAAALGVSMSTFIRLKIAAAKREQEGAQA